MGYRAKNGVIISSDEDNFKVGDAVPSDAYGGGHSQIGNPDVGMIVPKGGTLTKSDGTQISKDTGQVINSVGADPLAQPGTTPGTQPSPQNTQIKPPSLGTSPSLTPPPVSSPITQATPTQQGYNAAVASGQPPPQTSGQGAAAVQGFTPPPPPAPAPIVGTLEQSPEYAQLLKDYADQQSTIKQRESFTDMYKSMSEEMGIDSMNTDLMNMKNVIDGTEDDLRNEVTKAGGFATESQILAMTNARNKQLIVNYNHLLDAKNNAQSNLTTMMGLASQDRAAADTAMNNQLNFDAQMVGYREKFIANAQTSMQNTINAIGYDGMYQNAIATGDPTAVSRVEQTLGMPAGSLAIASSQALVARQNAQMKDKLSLDLMRSQLTTEGLQQKKLINDMATDSGAIGPLQLAQGEGNISQITTLSNSNDLSKAVGPNAFARFSLFEPFTSARSNFVAGVEQLRTQLSLDNLIEAKKNGATFGALSDTEMKILSNSATKLSSWAVKDGNDNVIGYKTSEGAFKQEMDKINYYAKLDYLLKGGSPESVGVVVKPDGTYWTQNSIGTFSQIQ